MGSLNMEKKWVFPLVISSLICVFLLATSFNMGLISSLHTINHIFNIFPLRLNQTGQGYAETKVSQSPPPPPPGPKIPRFAYLVSGSKGDLEKLWRTLHALYHPRNHYVVHLDLESPAEERLELASRVEKHPMFSKFGNVYMTTKANMVTYRGPTMVSNTLHACAILLKKSKDWDWFINLSASDYPLVTQDDLLDTFSTLNRNLNFIEHTSQLGWKEDKRAMPLIVDPGLYSTTKEDIFSANPRRPLPTAFKLFTGSAWMVLTRPFAEYLIWGWDNLPRTLLMYYTNFVSSPEGYFHTVICNAPEFARTAINHDLHYIAWARKFRQDDPALEKIDNELLGRRVGAFTPGGWCSDSPNCTEVGDINNIKPGPGADRLKHLIARVALLAKRQENQCK
ncbi:Beta-glucuronosyltransferase GlcAT14B [Linum perenne]